MACGATGPIESFSGAWRTQLPDTSYVILGAQQSGSEVEGTVTLDSFLSPPGVPIAGSVKYVTVHLSFLWPSRLSHSSAVDQVWKFEGAFTGKNTVMGAFIDSHGTHQNARLTRVTELETPE
jgi:hypothetical protein